MRAVLDAVELEREARFRFEKDRALYLCSHAMLRQLCSSYLDGAPESFRFEFGERGRPFLAGEAPVALDFNISHTSELVACGFTSRGRVGVDVEQIERRALWREIQHRVLSTSEQRELAELPGELARPRFFEYWTVKEAIAKAWGTGLATEFRKVEISFREERATFAAPPPAGLHAPCLLHLERLPEHRLAMAVVDGSVPPEANPVPVVRQWGGMTASEW